MREADIEAVVAIHRQSFPDSRSTKLGKPFLRKMYRWFVTYQPDLAFFACKDGQPAGFVTGAIGGSTRKIFRYALWEIMRGFLRHPGFLLRPEMFEAWRGFLLGIIPRYKKAGFNAGENTATRKATLDSIAVSPHARGENMGKALVDTFEVAAVNLGATVLALGVERDNLAARQLYESCGWELLKEDKKTNSANYSKEFERT